ncbi:hypothetical protein LOTGIDRAFT_152814 [Lottia gigantea]|uniref:Uncharacterized protein n=1 Tax=Lottia gigantea TaxID=225164 RepID=V4AS73_LOTGI|nr:hypothetical protein LOTGIDRAFT_152814 [Lottia gigantea]ESO97720.1 hypothetical protein LOTGIDRAFT_152814 [Lottia gigantea]
MCTFTGLYFLISAIDTEFTGLQLDETTKASLFDTSDERYVKLKKNVSEFTMSQIGISAFVNKESYRYEAHTFNFYLFPTAFGSFDVRFKCQASSLSFLCRYNFDFNKFVYDGVSYLNRDEELKLKEHLAKNTMFSGLEREVDEEVLQKICSDIAEWFVKSQVGEVFLIELDQNTREIKDYVLHTEIRNRFPNVWTHKDQLGKFIVEHVSSKQRRELQDIDSSNRLEQEEKLLQTMLGFTKVFRLLQDYNKIVVGHNMLTDLMLMFEKFHKPLPESFSEFKKEVHQILPRIYDTKHMSATIRKELEETGLLEYTSLQKLYQAFSSDVGLQVVLFSPEIHHAAGCERYIKNDVPHEAGFDAFMCGSVFLYIAHILSCRTIRSTEIQACSFTDYVPHLKRFLNKINIIRATINHVTLDGNDPISQRPQILFVRVRKNGFRLKSNQLAQWFSSYGTVDVKLQSNNTALVATGNFGCARQILRCFKGHDRIVVSKYNVWKHSRLVRAVLWSAVVLSSGICMVTLLSSLEPS